MVTLACVGALAMGVTACVPSEPKPTPTPTKTAIFASEDEALQAAVDVFQQFSSISDLVATEGDAEETQYLDVMTDAYYEEFISDTSLEERGWHAEGSSTFDGSELVELDQDSDSAEVRIAVCRDFTNQKVYNEAGTDITDEERISSLIPLEITFTWTSEESGLLMADLTSWDGSDVCSSQS
ncbi:hypothetical protein [Paramicrobacterium chengjingii]|uniref:hypothetical protein n=1 Tax=Paramicrobacterium chengjingii TaxID=2769067 RepID=UPI00141F6DC2|nr:hypothetical protein [Microbacterium chengjingii]